jgi:hypothetical protein
MSFSTHRRQSGISRQSATLIALLSVGALAAGYFYLWLNPTNAPILETPAAGAVAHGTATGATPTLIWRHGFGTTNNPQPRRASRFVVCVLAAGQQCALPGTFPAGNPATPMHVFTVALMSVPRTPVTVPPGVATLYVPQYPWLDKPYRYTYVLPSAIPPSDFARVAGWAVGACSGSTNDDCVYAAMRPFRIARNINLVAEGADDSVTNNVLDFDAAVGNTGAEDAGAFKIEFVAYQLLLSLANNSVRIDVDSTDLAEFDIDVLLKDGRLVKRDDVPRLNGNVDANKVVGIVKPGTLPMAEEAEIPGLAAGAGGISVAQVSMPIGGISRPARFGLVIHADSAESIPETEESDNRLAERSNLYP